MMTTELRERIINHLNNSVSFTLICQKEKVKKHEVESVYNSIRKNPDTTLDSPTSAFQTVQADTMTKHKASEEVEKLQLQLAILEKTKVIEDIRLKQIQESENTIRMKNSADNALVKAKADAELLKQKQEMKIVDAADKERKKAVKTLQTKINEFLMFFAEQGVNNRESCDQDQANEYLSHATKFKKQFLKLFGNYDYQEMLHFQALEMLEFNFTGNFEINYLSASTNFYVFDEQEIELLESCLAEGVELGDTEVSEQEEDED